MDNREQLIIVGMSGGVDSSVAALELQRQGYRVEGLFMKNWEEDDTSAHCTATEDLEYARQICDILQIPLHTVNFAAEYWELVFEYFLAEYQACRTPNPDILCNSEIKFKVFLEYANNLGASAIATGHYAAKDQVEDKFVLKKSLDQNKDQTYFLHALNQQQLEKAIFPLAAIEKPKVRELAENAGFPNYQRKDSTGICFIGERKFKEFLQKYLAAQPGKIVTLEGEIIGKHDGLMYYTLGQRQGLNIGGLKDKDHNPWYVAKKNIPSNELIAVQGKDHPALFKDSLATTTLTWIAGEAPGKDFRCNAKIRYRQADQPCKVNIKTDNIAIVEFEQPQRAITPGQSVVFYQGDTCLGGGIIGT